MVIILVMLHHLLVWLAIDQHITKFVDWGKVGLPQARSTVWRLGVSSAPEKPQWVLGGMQTNKSGSQENTAAVFDHCNLTNMHVWLNHSRYPSVDMATYFTKEQYAGVYKSFYDFASRYYGIDNLLAGSAVKDEI